MEKRLIFLLYDARSGSTLLLALLNRYRGISVSQESTFIHRIIEYDGQIHSENLEKIFQILSSEVQFKKLNFNPQSFIQKTKLMREKYYQKKS